MENLVVKSLWTESRVEEEQKDSVIIRCLKGRDRGNMATAFMRVNRGKVRRDIFIDID